MKAPDQTEAHPLELVESIRTLSPAQRRRLLRRLRVSGLVDAEALLTDRNKLRIAPALGDRFGRPLSVNSNDAVNKVNGEPESDIAPVVETHLAAIHVAIDSDKLAEEADESEGDDQEAVYNSASGRAPEESIVVIFDGGVRGEPPVGYGSYAVRWPGLPQQIVQLRFGEGNGEHEAVYDSLIAALESVLRQLEGNNTNSSTAKVDIRGDSTLIIEQITGQKECESPSLQRRCDRVLALLARTGSWRLSRYHPKKTTDAGKI